MNILKWYSAIVVSFSLASLLIEAAMSEYTDGVTFWAFILYLPIGIYLWKLVVGK